MASTKVAAVALPDLSHLSSADYERVYEPSDDTFLLVDALSADVATARITVVASGVPPGLGEPVFDRLDADLAYAMMGINAVKAVEIGAGVQVVAQRGSEHHGPGGDSDDVDRAVGGRFFAGSVRPARRQRHPRT
jgi:hypothetical protein